MSLPALAEYLDYVPEPLLLGLVGVGTLAIGRFLLKTFFVFAQTFVLPGTSVKKYAAKSGSWAVVTGATDGIGKEFALQLARAKYNIVLISRNDARLKVAAEEISQRYQCETRTLAIDFTNVSEDQYEQLTNVCSDLDIGVLVNNVGRSHELPVSFASTPIDELNSIIAVNVSATLRITNIVLQKMISQRRGLVLTISSFAGEIPSPLLATYSGSKAFLQTWSDALQSELAGTGVDVECLSTYFVVSNMSKIRRASALIPLPRAYVSAALGKLGLPCGALWTGRPSTSTPFWSHAILDYAMHVVGWKGLFIKYTLGLHKNIRTRALRKKAREATKKE